MRHLGNGFDGESKPNCFDNSDQRGEARVSPDRQSAVQTLSLTAGGFGHLGDALGLREMTQRSVEL